MKPLLNSIKSLIKITVIVFLTSCSTLMPENANEGAKQACAQIAARYIKDSIDANLAAISNFLYVSKFLENQKILAPDYEAKLKKLKDKWEISKHPLANLSIKNIDVNGDNAEVIMQRDDSGNKSFPKIKIFLFWTGSSWTIIDDNIFGKGEIFDNFK